MSSPIAAISTTVSALLNSLLSVFSNFTLSIVGGFLSIPITQMRIGSAFTDMGFSIPYPDPSGNYQLGQAYNSNNTLTGPTYQQAPTYQPGNTTPPKSFPTTQANGYVVPLGVNAVGMYHLSAEALRILKMFEGPHQRPYTINGTTYIGYGHQITSNNPSQYMSMDQINSMLAADVLAAEGIVKGAISVPLTQGQFDALVDFAFTTTAAKFQTSDVMKKFNAGDIPGTMTALAQVCYVQTNNVISRSLHLTSRRAHNIQWMSMPILPLPPN